jgi:lactoylglutathione lyase
MYIGFSGDSVQRLSIREPRGIPGSGHSVHFRNRIARRRCACHFTGEGCIKLGVIAFGIGKVGLIVKTSWVEICVSNLDESIIWFSSVLGFQVTDQNEHYAGLRRGETSILLGTDNGPYWEQEQSRLPEPGLRGSGVEIVLLVDQIEDIYTGAQQAGAEIVRPLETWPWNMKQFWVRHPDGYLLRPAQRLGSHPI